MRAEVEQELAHTLLIELLAYQFASPVRWIESQDVILKDYKAERIIEIGPSPTLIGMAKRTLSKYEAFDQALNINRELLSYSNDKDAIYYASNDAPAPKAAAPTPKAAPAPAPKAAPAPVAAPAPAPVAAAAGPVADEGIKAAFMVQVLVAHKLKKPLSDIPMTKTIKELVNGKSTVQNEILGDLGKEFGATPEKPEDTPLQELAEKFQDSYNGQLGKTSSTLVSKLMSSKMPGGFSLTVAKKYLETKFGLGPLRQDAVLLTGVVNEPSARLASEGDAKAFLDDAAQKYAASNGVTLGAPAAAAAAPVAMGGAPAGPAGPAQAIPDEPVKAQLLLHVLVAAKLKKPMEQIPLSKSIKDLVNGKSTIQNEILGDLGKEFGETPEKPEEIPLQELAETMQEGFSGQLGKTSSSLINKLFAAKFPGGYGIGVARRYLESTYGLGAGRQDSVFLVALANEPAARLGGEPEAKAFLDESATKYASTAGISLSQGGAGGAVGGGAMIDTAALEEITKDQKFMAKQHLKVLAKYLKVDLKDGEKQYLKQKEANELLQKELDFLSEELGETFVNGIKPSFSAKKARVYNSYWAWARQDLLSMYYEIIFGNLSEKDINRDIIAKCISIMNRANPELIKFMEYFVNVVANEKAANSKDSKNNYELAKQLGGELIKNCKQALSQDPVFKDVRYPTGPKTKITEKGDIVFEETRRENIRTLESYIRSIAQGSALTSKVPTPGAVVAVSSDEEYELCDEGYDSASDEVASLSSFSSIKKPVSESIKSDRNPFLFMQKKTSTGEWVYDTQLTSTYLNTLESMAVNGASFKKTVLLTGAGRGSIGAEILKGLLSGGATVVVTTSRFSLKVTQFFQDVYKTYGGRGSKLILVPFNQGSKADCQSLINFIYNEQQLDLDAIIPFGAIPEQGITAASIDSKSELAHRIMLTNIMRILGFVKNAKESRGINTRPAQLLLPMSPNHGLFGNDGLYSESKIGLETLLNKWDSEDWKNYVTVTGAIIGWTRGTGLMAVSNIVAEKIESYGCRTFSQQEMAFNLLGLLTDEISEKCEEFTLKADLNGGFEKLSNLKEINIAAREKLMEESAVKRQIAIESSLDHKSVYGADGDFKRKSVKPRANDKFAFPALKSYKEVKDMSPHLKGLLSLENVIVVTGFGEVNPHGSAETRWEMESAGEFSLEGCIYLANIMGLIKFDQKTSGWIDTKSNKPVEEATIKKTYEETILEHTGIRLIEPEMFDGYDPNNKQFIQEVVLQHDLEAFESSEEDALHFQQEHKEFCEIFPLGDSGEYQVYMKKGAKLFVPKALRFDRLVAGQIPSGWDAKKFGISQDIIDQVDVVTLFNLVSTISAFIKSGIRDPYELYQYIHVSEIGICTGSGMGGVTALKGMFKHRFMEKEVQNDILQESFINTMSAWVNMLILSSSGPIKTPVGACATAVESVDTGVETILSGKAKICLVGGYDDFQEEGSYEFANMNATSNSIDEMAAGRTPSEMSRPCTSTRNGFMESQGAGVQIIMTADLAIKMGLPIYGIIAMTATAADKIGKSVPAPGQGVLTVGKESHAGNSSKLILDPAYRKRQLDRRIRFINESLEDEIMEISTGDDEDKELLIEEAKQLSQTQVEEAKKFFGNEFFKKDPRISDLRGALATFGLGIDDISLASFHGTSTKANDKNESDVIHNILKHLGRSEGNPVFGIFQKYLTGHPKGAAGAWMLDGVLQALNSGIIPGNRNLDNVDGELRKFTNILYLSETIKTDNLKASFVTSFGFGQKGGFVLVIHPDYLYSALEQKEYEEYASKVSEREQAAYSHYHESIVHDSLFQEKANSPYDKTIEQSVYLDPLARVVPGKEGLEFTKKGIQQNKYLSGTDATTKTLISLTAGEKNVGVDVEQLDSIDIENQTFIERNFTDAEIAYCKQSPHPQSSFTGTWSAKEAVFKSLRTKSQGGGAALKEIEIVRENNIPSVKLSGDAAAKAAEASITGFKVSISHDDVQAVAVAIAEF
ncbi:trifunctional fatty acid synthase subunit [Saccharomycopsis crataegensis]|uniref:Fatty acid synthase subunit alpha n=1 Tax=Saccharomycopsis crataegensis TaxID=43959 RepID=A0AAV5QKT0_9ASCO|nr:trifunctional fatty acid synthase subunit [Saccharomycopsis crataegensis]